MALELELDDELRREGIAREVVHAVQNARKAAGLQVEDRIELALGGDDALLEAVREHEAYVAGETLALAVSYENGLDGASEATIEGRPLTSPCAAPPRTPDPALRGDRAQIIPVTLIRGASACLLAVAAVLGAASTASAADWTGALSTVDGLRVPAAVRGPSISLSEGKGRFSARFWPGVNLGSTIPGARPARSRRARRVRPLAGRHGQIGARWCASTRSCGRRSTTRSPPTTASTRTRRSCHPRRVDP